MNLTYANQNVEYTGRALDHARQTLSVLRNEIKAAEEEESRRDTAYKIAVDQRSVALEQREDP